MIVVNSRGRIYTLDNKDPQVVRITQTELRETEELTGKDIAAMSSASIESNRRFINGE